MKQLFCADLCVIFSLCGSGITAKIGGTKFAAGTPAFKTFFDDHVDHVLPSVALAFDYDTLKDFNY